MTKEQFDNIKWHKGLQLIPAKNSTLVCRLFEITGVDFVKRDVEVKSPVSGYCFWLILEEIGEIVEEGGNQ